MTNPLLRYILFVSARASTGSVTSESKSVTSPVTNAKKADFGGFVGKEGVIFFNETLQGSYWHSFKWNGILRIGPEAIWKNDIFSCGLPISMDVLPSVAKQKIKEFPPLARVNAHHFDKHREHFSTCVITGACVHLLNQNDTRYCTIKQFIPLIW